MVNGTSYAWLTKGYLFQEQLTSLLWVISIIGVSFVCDADQIMEQCGIFRIELSDQIYELQLLDAELAEDFTLKPI